MPTIARKVNASNQDCLVWRDIFHNWQFSLTHKEVKVGYSSLASYSMGAGLYFPNVDIPPGSTILRAYLILRSAELSFGREVSSIIELEDNPNPIPFSTAADFWARPPLSPYVRWRFGPYERWTKDQLYGSPDFSVLVQQIIDLPGWAEGNPIVVFWTDRFNNSEQGAGAERVAYSYDENLILPARLEITYSPPTPLPPPQPPLPPPPPPQRKGWAGLDLQYEYLDDGFKLTFHTDVPCHLWCRMTTTPPRKHSLPSYRRGLYLQGDIRFCFVVYEDNEQAEADDTLVHTFLKGSWPVCERRWFYFIGRVYGDNSPSESPIFEFHFPAPPPEPPPPMEKIFITTPDNRTMRATHAAWFNTWWGANLLIGPWHDAPTYYLVAGASLTATYWIWRAPIFFDTRPLPDTAKIQSAHLSIYCLSKMQTSSVAHPYIYATQCIRTPPVTNAHWGSANPWDTPLGELDLASIILNQYNNIPLNQDGLDLIKIRGTTMFYIRQEMDVKNISPPLGTNQAVFHSQQKGAGFWPLLKVQYYPA